MHQPASAATHVQYADVLYTIGGTANYQTARTHYSAAIDITSGQNVRALYGLCAASAQLRNDGSKVRPWHRGIRFVLPSNDWTELHSKCLRLQMRGLTSRRGLSRL